MYSCTFYLSKRTHALPLAQTLYKCLSFFTMPKPMKAMKKAKKTLAPRLYPAFGTAVRLRRRVPEMKAVDYKVALNKQKVSNLKIQIRMKNTQNNNLEHQLQHKTCEAAQRPIYSETTAL